jgi:hypothetical protein
MRFSGWTQKQAISLCIKLEQIAVKYNGHVALTGGTLYYLGTRKDLDILIYPVRGSVFDWPGFFDECEGAVGLEQGKDFGWCKKATHEGRHIDFFDPMAPEGEHSSGAEEEWLL